MIFKKSMNIKKAKNIGIVGNGWLGSGLNEFWTKSPQINSRVYSRTPTEDGVALELSPQTKELPLSLKASDIIIYTLPPGSDSSLYLETLVNFTSLMAQTTKLILISTTSVLEKNQGRCTEETLPQVTSERASDLQKAEEWLLKGSPKNVVLRSGGQYGKDRYPARFLANKDVLTNSSAPVNVIHHHDLCRLIHFICLNDTPNLIHGVSPLHPTKESFYKEQAKALGLKLPEGDGKGEQGKVVDSLHLKKLGFSFEKSNEVL